MQTPRLQQGSAIVIAVFIIVVMSLLAAALTRMLQDSHQGIGYEVYGTRAYLAANAGIEQGLLKLFPLGGGAPVCGSASLDLSAQTAFHGCVVEYACVEKVVDSKKVYQIDSTAKCDAGEFITRRKIQAQAKEL
ncbi:MSHA biogenesis protein MshP [Motilimonas eburnea]|uniref:MSHA biogenesis protein MshP n=1 Tax=Motilimonas eburnea TaxID=1737488 RepID=UPI001E4FF2B7|nr:MSHA biogenesis protein MshP [Motilimonas eburnea]MCE2572122.1 MSHA biogenesis protein MshP [Motilimonas eburnea]